MRRLGIAIVAAYLLFCLGLAALADEVFAVSSSPWFYVIAVGLLLPAVLPAWRERLARLAALVYLAVLVLLAFVSLAPRKPFRQFYEAIDSGMTPDQVRAEPGRRFRLDGPFARPVEDARDESLWFQLDPNQGAYNAEFVVVYMVQGKVAAKEFLPD